jgi:hypothetical protein
MTVLTTNHDNSAASQRSRILKHLREVGPITTLGARAKTESVLVWLACWEMLPAALTVLLLEGLRHD